jgi:DivIVA domain-containing protein
MDGTPHLLTDVKFSERRRGYDPDEVDNFLERVSAAVAQLQDKLRQATARAEEADARIMEAERSRAVAESEVERLKAATPSAPSPADATATADAAAKVLALAQQTADQVVADANQTATATLAESQARAGTMVGDAERRADEVLADAHRRADQLADERQQALVDEVQALEQVRSQLQGDVDLLNRHLDGQRASLRVGVAEIMRLLDDPAAFRTSAAPATSGATLPGDVADRPSPVVVGGDAPTAEQPAVTSPAAEAEPTERTGAEPQAETEPTAEGEPETALADTGGAPDVSEGAAPEGADAESAPTIDLADGDADPAAATDRDTQLFATLDDTPAPRRSAAPLGEPDADADEAMRAFFEADFEEPRDRTRFGRRR